MINIYDFEVSWQLKKKNCQNDNNLCVNVVVCGDLIIKISIVISRPSFVLKLNKKHHSDVFKIMPDIQNHF